MGAWLKRLWTDEDAFLSAFRSLSGWTVGALFAIAQLVSAGAIDLGAFGWWGGRIAQAAVVMLAFQARRGITPTQATKITRAVGI